MSSSPEMRRGVTHLQYPAAPGAGNALAYSIDNSWWRRIVSLYFTYTASSAAGLRVPVINYQDGDGNTFNQTLAVAAISGGEAWTVSVPPPAASVTTSPALSMM